MKQNTTPEQTAKLIELGFEKPKSYHNIEWDGTEAYGYQLDYSIGELIEMLPMSILHELRWWTEDEGVWGLRIDTNGTEYVWTVSYARESFPFLNCETRSELIDALYDMILRLKAEGVI
jgi:hypothetical protein